MQPVGECAVVLRDSTLGEWTSASRKARHLAAGETRESGNQVTQL